MSVVVHRTGQMIGVQRRMLELGRIRMGDKRGTNGAQRKLTEFRLTSASKMLLEAAAAEYGGEVKPWDNAPDEGYFELYTTTKELDVILPPTFADADGAPTVPFSQFYELWSGGGCQRRCDGQTETLTGKPCICGDARGDGDKFCRITTRLSVMLPKVPGLGVWRLESHGWNAASILPGTIEVLMLAAADRSFIPAILRLEAKTSKKDGQTRKFVVPVLDLPSLKIGEVLAGGGMSGRTLNAPAAPPVRPELPAGEAPPDEPAAFENDVDPEMGEPPEIVDVVDFVEEDASLDGPSETSVVEGSRVGGVTATPSVQPAGMSEGPSSDAISAAWTELTDLVTKLGAVDSLEGINAKAAIGDLPWLKRQITRARKSLAEKERYAKLMAEGYLESSAEALLIAESNIAASAETLAEQETLTDGYFAKRGQEVQDKQAARKGRK